MPMKWHKFQIYFALWLNVVISVVSAFSAFTGMQYGEMADRVYRTFDGLKEMDMLYGMLQLLCAVVAVVVRFRLAAMRRSGIKGLLAMYVLNVAVELLYAVVVGGMIGAVAEVLGEMAPSFVGAAAGFFINRAYYKNREVMFS